MITIKLQGGLGNQMFQYAAARSLSKKIFLDLDFLEVNCTDKLHFTARTFQLGIFENLKIKRSSTNNLLRQNNIAFRVLGKLFKSRIIHIKQTTNDFINLPGSGDLKYIYLDGYFQSEKYFSHIKKEIRDEFKFPALDIKNLDIANQIRNSENATSIHIRRGDYVKSSIVNDIHGTLPKIYYQKAVSKLLLDFPKISIFVFSDDIKWARKHLNFENCNFISNNIKEESWKDMALMSLCKHHIIANSSFSWWGAWLSIYEGQKYAPVNWFNPKKIKYNLNDIIPREWNIIDYD
ncbi:MAG: alpha-1,2-fucosyltransferase [Pedobacter sp.]|nr:MAG: alpha-1,2-fucosyltransferase [Pedobacter sp.]